MAVDQCPDPHRSRMIPVLEAALRAVDPCAAVAAHMRLDGNRLQIGDQTYDLEGIERILVVGGGKAGMPMAATVGGILGQRIAAGAVNVKYGHATAGSNWQVRFGRVASAMPPLVPDATPPDLSPVTITEAGHPVPDARGQAGAERITALLSDLTVRDLVIVLISGGGSALLPLPADGIPLADYQALNALLLRCGADITEINAVRKHCSRLQGGQLARLATPARVACLILSDVVGSRLDAIASGPTVPDPTTFADALAVLDHHGITHEVPASVIAHLQRGVDGIIPETPKPGDPLFDRVTNVIIGDNARAGAAAVAEARRQGWQSLLLSTFIQGEAREVGKVVAGLAQGIARGQSDLAPPVCLVLGGETTVTIRGNGHGGRNQELALAAAVALDAYPMPADLDLAVVSLATDGTDGPTDAAGGIATPDTLSRGRALGLDAREALDANDSFHYLDAVGDLLITGPTQTNVNDLIFVFVSPGWGQDHKRAHATEP